MFAPNDFSRCVFLLSMCFFVSCSSTLITDRQNSIVALLGCEQDAYSDLLFSLDGIRNFAEKNNISIRLDESEERCGYLLLGKEQKYIEGAITDADLMILVKEFFAKEDLN